MKKGVKAISSSKYLVPSEAPGIPWTLLDVWGLAAVFLELGGAVDALSHLPHPR